MPETIANPGTLTRWVVNFLDVPQDQIVGCTEAEIAEVEKLAGLPLPRAYRQMLREIGRSVGTGRVHAHFRRMSVLYPDVLEVKGVAADLLRGGDARVLETAFPFYSWEVYATFLLDLSRPADDPPVLALDEVTGTVQPETRTLSHFIATEIFDLADVRRLRSGPPNT